MPIAARSSAIAANPLTSHARERRRTHDSRSQSQQHPLGLFCAVSYLFCKVYGGEGEIRTPDRVTPMPDFESGAFNRALPPLRDGYSHFPQEIAGARRPANQIRKQRKSTKPAPRSTPLEHSPAVSRVHDANAHHKFTGVARVVAILLQFNQTISTFATSQLITFTLPALCLSPIPLKCYFTVWSGFVLSGVARKPEKKPHKSTARTARRLHGSLIFNDGVPHLSKGPRTLPVRRVALLL